MEVIFDDGRKTNDPVLAIRMLVTSPVNAGSRTSARFVHGQVSSASIPVSTATSIHKIARGYAACWAVQRRARGGGRDQFRLANTFVASLPFISSVLWLTSSPRPHTYYPPPPPPKARARARGTTLYAFKGNSVCASVCLRSSTQTSTAPTNESRSKPRSCPPPGPIPAPFQMQLAQPKRSRARISGSSSTVHRRF